MNVRRCNATRVFGLAALIACAGVNLKADTLPPTVPFLLSATAATCGQVNLAWTASTDEVGGSGLQAYIVSRNDGVSTTIGSGRTTFSDTNYVKSSTTLTYTVAARDAAGNVSAASNSVTVSTPACPMAAGETALDGPAYFEPLGKAIAVYGTRSAAVYIKQNQNLSWDAWIAVNDSDTGASSHFLLHSSPGYYQLESDYVLTSATDLWTLAWDSSNSGKMIVSQYKL